MLHSVDKLNSVRKKKYKLFSAKFYRGNIFAMSGITQLHGALRCILYIENDTLTFYSTIPDFAERTISTLLTVMKNGEYWFHTENYMAFLGD